MSDVFVDRSLVSACHTDTICHTHTINNISDSDSGVFYSSEACGECIEFTAVKREVRLIGIYIH